MTSMADPNLEESLAILISREIRDFETSACGALSFIPATGILLGAEMHAPNAEVIILGSRDYVPFVSGKDFHFLAQRGQMDLFFISGSAMGKVAHFSRRARGGRGAAEVLMPGQYGTGMLYYAVPRIIMFRTEHTKRTFVEKVSYISGAGTSPEGFSRRTKEVKVITPMAVLVLNQETRVLELDSVHPGYTAEQVQENTGFDLGIKGDIPTTPPITENEIRTLRTTVKAHMIESETYPDLARTRIQEA